MIRSAPLRALHAMEALETWRRAAKARGSLREQIDRLKGDLDILSDDLRESAEGEDISMASTRHRVRLFEQAYPNPKRRGL